MAFPVAGHARKLENRLDVLDEIYFPDTGQDEVFGPDGTLFNPVAQRVGLLFGKRLALGWHDVVIVRRQHREGEKGTFFGFANHDGRAVFAPDHRVCTSVQPKVALGFFRAVTAEALEFQNWFDFLLKIDPFSRLCERYETSRCEEKAFV